MLQGEPLTPVRITTPQTPIRFHGIAGEVLWQATTDGRGSLQTLRLQYPNRIGDTIRFDEKDGVSVTRRLNSETLKLTPSMTRQSLVHARIIAGPHLQLALEKAFGQTLNSKTISDDAIARISAKIASNGLDLVSTRPHARTGAQNLRARFAGLVNTQAPPSLKNSPQSSLQTIANNIGQVAQNAAQPNARKASTPRV